MECKSELKQYHSKSHDLERELNYLRTQCKKIESERNEFSTELANCLKERNRLEGRTAELEKLTRYCRRNGESPLVLLFRNFGLILGTICFVETMKNWRRSFILSSLRYRLRRAFHLMIICSQDRVHFLCVFRSRNSRPREMMQRCSCLR